MRRSPLTRFARLLAAALVASSTPGLALSHSHAHRAVHERVEHSHEHDHGRHESPQAPSSGERRSEVESADGPQDHAHPEISPGVSTRAELPLLAAPATVPLPVDVVVETQASLLLTAAPPRAGPPDAPPRQPRAPPLA